MNARTPRLLDPGYLAWLRMQPCACGCARTPCDPAHVRSGALKYKPLTGLGRKPDDRWAVPLHHGCHMRQHAHGDELGWWYDHGVYDVFALCKRYYATYGGTGGKPQARKIVKPRKPKSERARIQSRPFEKFPGKSWWS